MVRGSQGWFHNLSVVRGSQGWFPNLSVVRGSQGWFHNLHVSVVRGSQAWFRSLSVVCGSQGWFTLRRLQATINYYSTPPYCEFQFAPITKHDYVKTQALRYAHDNDHVMNEQIAVG